MEVQTETETQRERWRLRDGLLHLGSDDLCIHTLLAFCSAPDLWQTRGSCLQDSIRLVCSAGRHFLASPALTLAVTISQSPRFSVAETNTSFPESILQLGTLGFPQCSQPRCPAPGLLLPEELLRSSLITDRQYSSYLSTHTHSHTNST